MPARQSASLLLKFGVAALFLGGIGFGAVAALSQADAKGKPKPGPEVANAEPSKPTPAATSTPEPKPEPKLEPKTPEVKPEPKKADLPNPEVKKPEPEPKKPEPKPEPPKASAVTFQQVQRVLRDNCTVCHGAPKIEAMIDLRTLDSIKKKKGLLVPGDPEASDLYGSMKAGTMPPQEVKTRPTDAEMKIVHDWIAGGAK